ncbi:mpv17-like protein 2 [Tubulanus polymorphus]|uniref:mpv17-like protein 2 n=1 Tax=Tubulanus polymorphus TaxID=672921 RepID=UPI003DA616C3
MNELLIHMWIIRNRSILTKISTVFSKYSLIVNTSITVISGGIGDFIQQRYQIETRSNRCTSPVYCKPLRDHKDRIDYQRTCRMSVKGFVTGPFNHYWFYMIDKLITGRGFIAVMKKLVLDCVISQPVNTAMFFTTMAALEGNYHWSYVREELRTKGRELLKTSLIVFMPVTFMTYSIIPLAYRVMFDNMVGLSIDVYQSWLKYESVKTK